MKNFNLKNIGFLVLTVSLVCSGAEATSNTTSPTQCDYSAPSSQQVVVTTVTGSGGGCWVSKDIGIDVNCQLAQIACIDQITTIAKDNPVVANQLSCGASRQVAWGCADNNGNIKSSLSASCEADVIKTVPLTIAQAVQAKCSKIAACLENVNDVSAANQLNAHAQALKCQ